MLLTARALCEASSVSTLQEAQVAYDEGRYLDAAAIAEDAGGAKGFTFAASSVITHFVYYADKGERTELYQRALQLTERSLEIDSKNSRTHYELARAVGEYALTIGRIRAMSEGVAERIKEHLEIALSAGANSAMVHHGMGRWHAHLIEKIGPFLAGSLFGAKKKEAVFHLDRALELDPQGIDIMYGSAIGFLTLDKREYRDKAKGLLKNVINIPARHAYQTIIHQRAMQLMKELNASDDQDDSLQNR